MRKRSNSMPFLYSPASVVMLLCLVCGFGLSAKAQSRRGLARTSGSQSPQWQLGFRAGLNFGHATPTAGYTAFANTNPFGREDDQKVYAGNYARQGTQVGLELVYMLHYRLGLSLLPGFYTHAFGYKSAFGWQLYDDGSRFTSLEVSHEQRLNYLEVPLLLRYYMGEGPIKPYVQGGAWIGRLQDARREVSSLLQDNTAGESEPLRVQSNEEFGVNNRYISTSTGWIAGAGVAMDLGHVPSGSNSTLGIVRFVLAVNYRQGLHNISNARERFADGRLLTQYYDVPDDIELAGLEVSLSCLFTFKYDFL